MANGEMIELKFCQKPTDTESTWRGDGLLHQRVQKNHRYPGYWHDAQATNDGVAGVLLRARDEAVPRGTAVLV
jgi:hypothetical protein